MQSGTVITTAVLCRTAALITDAPAMSAANPAAAKPAIRGMSRPMAPASSAVPTR
jgi:hypothetical protein